MSSARAAELLRQLIPDSREHLTRILAKHRQTFWGNSQLTLRVRDYPKAGGGQRVSLVKPQIHSVKLYSQVLQKQVELQVTPGMLKTIESRGGLDSYLIKTPDQKLHSDAASNLKWEIMCKINQRLAPPPAPAAASGSRPSSSAAAQK